MCNPIQQEHEIQQAPAPIVVQEQDQAVQQAQAVEQAQEQQQAVQQEQVQQQQQAQQQPAAPVDAAPAQTQNKKKTERIAPVTRKQVRGNFSDVRKNAFQENLMDNVRMDAAVHDSKPYRAVMDAIRDYASMNLEKTSTDKQSAALAKARRLLRAHPATPDAQDAEECISDVYLRVWERFSSFDRARGSLAAWLTAVARNAAVDRRRAVRPPDEAWDGQAGAAPSPEDELLRRERTRQLKRAVDALGAAEQVLFYRKYYYLQSTAQIAAEMGLSERAVEGRLYRLRRRLQKAMGGDAR